MPVKGKEDHDREMALLAEATVPADLAAFDLPTRMGEAERTQFAKGVTALRNGNFYLAHDLWEDVWHSYRPSDRIFLQGLIHIAVGSYHMQCSNARGASSQLGKAIAKMVPFGPVHWGIDVETMVRHVEALREADLEGPDMHQLMRAVQQAI